MASGKDRRVLIVGAGVFGLSTALHLLQRGWKNITIIDRSPTLPAPDGASTDINRVIRSSYNDVMYTRLTIEAIAAWKNTEEWGDTFHQSGLIIRDGEGGHAGAAFQNDLDHGVNVKKLSSISEVHAQFSPEVKLGPLLLSDFEGFVNFDAGWANATQGVEIIIEKVRKLGARIETNKTVCGLTPDGLGVKLGDDTEMKADLIVIALGSWTPSTFASLGLGTRILATGQSTATIQLSEEEATVYRDIPMILDYSTGIYILPPNASNIVKFGMHAEGYTNMQNHDGIQVSTPRTRVTHPDGGAIPVGIAKSLRAALSGNFPDLGERPFLGTRMCWYTEAPNADWLIDYHPDHPSVLFATGGSGHAYKFLPTLGRLVADRLEHTLDPVLTKKFAFNRPSGIDTLISSTKELDPTQLC